MRSRQSSRWQSVDLRKLRLEEIDILKSDLLLYSVIAESEDRICDYTEDMYDKAKICELSTSFYFQSKTGYT